MAALKTKADGGDDFAVLARDNSDGTTAGTGGDIGWIAKGQLDDKLTAAIFAAPIGKTSDVVIGRRRRRLPVQGRGRGDPDARGPPARCPHVDRLLEVVRREEVGGDHHPRSGSSRAPSQLGGSRVLDALVAEARLRWGFDPAVGLQVVAGEALDRHARSSRRGRVLIVPLATLRATRRRVGRRRCPGGRGPAATTRWRSCGGCIRPTIPSGGSVSPTAPRSATLDADIARRRRCTSRPSRPRPPLAGPWAMPWISARLRQPDGCPWDREQTHTSLRKHLLEEAYEVYDALEAGATPGLAGELGDLWLQIVLHAQLAAEAGVFDLTDVQAAIASKIVRRHPHVFGDAVARTASDVNRQWERIKADERAAAADSAERRRG